MPGPTHDPMLEGIAAELERATGSTVILADDENRVLRWPASAERLFAVSSREALGRALSTVLPLGLGPRDDASVLETLRARGRWAQASDSAADTPTRVLEACALYDARGSLAAVLYRCRESSAESRELPLSSRRVASLLLDAFEGVGAELAIVDAERKLVALNARARAVSRAVLGRELEPGEDALLAAEPGSEEIFLEQFHRALGGVFVEHTGPLRYGNGAELLRTMQYVPLGVARNGGGAATAVLCAFWRNMVAVEELQRVRWTAQALAALRVGVEVLDAARLDGPVLYAAGRLPKVGRAQLERDGELSPARLALERAARGLETVAGVFTADETVGLVLERARMRAVPLRDSTGLVSHVARAWEDVTELRALEFAELRNTHAEERNTLLAGIAHDMRNTLMVLSAQLGFVRGESGPNEEVLEALAQGELAVQQLASMTRMISSAGAVVTSTRVVALREVFRALARLARYALPSTVQLELDEARGDECLAGGPYELVQVLLNLLFNARDALPEGGTVRIFVQNDPPEPLRARFDPDATRTLVVSDDGTGMDEATLARAFEVGFSTKGSGVGRGFGLSMCARAIEAAGGAVHIESTLGRGTTVFLTMPRGVGEGARARTLPPIDELKLVGVYAVLVEPDPLVRGSWASVLRKRGVDVHVAGDVSMGELMAQVSPKDATLLIDPSGDLEGAERLCSSWLAGAPERRVVWIDGDRPRRPRVCSLEKPFSFEALLRTLAR